MSSTASILLTLSVALLAGLLLSRLAKKVQLPAVTAYLVAGVLIGPFLLGALHVPGLGITHDQLAGFGIIADVALGFIAFSMGNEFRIEALKKIGCRVLALNGTNDVQVIASQNISALQKHVASELLTTKIYPELNHLFQHSSTGMPNEYYQIEETISPEVLSNITQWIKNK